MYDKMPGPKFQASQGGTCPRNDIVNKEYNDPFMRLDPTKEGQEERRMPRLRQATLKWPSNTTRKEERKTD
jgi:hypothetical protein